MQTVLSHSSVGQKFAHGIGKFSAHQAKIKGLARATNASETYGLPPSSLVVGRI